MGYLFASLSWPTTLAERPIGLLRQWRSGGSELARLSPLTGPPMLLIDAHSTDGALTVAPTGNACFADSRRKAEDKIALGDSATNSNLSAVEISVPSVGGPARIERRLIDPDGSEGEVKSIAWSDDGKLLFVVRSKGSGSGLLLRAYEAGTGKSVSTWQDDEHADARILDASSRAALVLVSPSGEGQPRLVVWRLQKPASPDHDGKPNVVWLPEPKSGGLVTLGPDSLCCHYRSWRTTNSSCERWKVSPTHYPVPRTSRCCPEGSFWPRLLNDIERRYWFCVEYFSYPE